MSARGAAGGSVHLAVDGGNSKTVALVLDGAGRVLGRGRAGCGDIYGAPTPQDACDAVFGAVESALAAAGVRDADVAAAAFRLAGIDYPEDEEFWRARVRERFGGFERFSLKNDAFASLRLIDGSGVGVSITVGTGPAIAARSRDGREECSGMYVFVPLGGAGLAASAIEAVTLAWMDLAPATLLTERMCALYDVPDGWELRHAFVRREGGRPWSDLLRATRLVLAVAEEGDAVARAIVERQAVEHVRYAGWCVRRVGEDLASGALPVLLNGSVATSELPAMRIALLAELARVAPAARVTTSSVSPLCGVALDALAEGGVVISPELLHTVRDDHPSDFLLT